MSIEAMSYVKKLEIAKPAQKLIMLLLAERIKNETGECFPGQELLAKEASMTGRSVRRHLSELVKTGLLKSRYRYSENGKRTSSAYEIVGFLDWLRCAEECAHRQRTNASGSEPLQDKSGETTGQNGSSLQDNGVRQTVRGNRKESKEGANDVRAGGSDGSETEESKSDKKRKAAKKPKYTQSFETFWQSYPRKRGKADAAKAWVDLSQEDREAAKNGIPAYVDDCKKERRPYRYGSTYLNQRTWEDYEDNVYAAPDDNDEHLVKLVVNYEKDQNTWGPRLEEKLGPPPGKPGCRIAQRIIDKAREVWRAERNQQNDGVVYA